MGFIPFVRILLRNQRSNKAATFGSMFGVLISIAFITGSFMTSDAVVSDLFQDQLDDIEYHFRANSWGWNRWDIDNSRIIDDEILMMDELRAQDGIEDAGLFKQIWGMNYNDREIGIFGLDEGGSRFLFDDSGISLPDNEFSCAITTLMAEEEDLSVGDSINITHYEYVQIPVEEEDATRSEPKIVIVSEDEPWYDPGGYRTERVPRNLTLNVSMVINDAGWSSVSKHLYSPGYRLYFDLGQFGELEDAVSDMKEYDEGSNGMILFKLDPDYFSNIDDAQKTRKEAKVLMNDIRDIIDINDYYIEENRVEEIYDNYLFWSITMRVFLVILSLPLFLLCFYLVLVGSRIGMENKVQEISLLKVKGATRGQIFWMLMLESLIHGSVGTIMGILIGTLLSSIFILAFLGESIGMTSLLPGRTMVITLQIISCVLVTLIRSRSMNRLSKMDILQAVRGSPERVEKSYRPVKDIVIILMISLLIGAMSYFNIFHPVGLFQLALYSLTTVLKPILVLFLPFLLILSISRLLVQGFPGTLDVAAKPLKGFTSELHSLLVKGLKYRKRSVAIMTILISITVSFGVLVLSQMETRENGIEVSLHSSVPTDLYVAAGGNNRDLGRNISMIEGVDDVITSRSAWVTFSTGSDIYEYGYGGYGTIIAFEVDEYISEVSPSDKLSKEGKWLGDLDRMEPGDGIPVIINSMSARENNLIVGDEINLTIESYRWSHDPSGERLGKYSPVFIECTVIGIVDHLPGLRSNTASQLVDDQEWGDENRYFLSDLYEEPAFYISLDNIPENTTLDYWGYLLDVTGDRDMIRENITSMDWIEGKVVVADRDEELEKIKEIPANKGLDLMLLIQFSCVLIAVVVGIFLMQVVQNTARRREFAEVLARGATRDNIFRLLLSEGLVVLMVGLVIGTFTGLLVGFAFQSIFTGDWASSIGNFGENLDVENRITVENGVVFPWTILLIHLVTIASMVSAIYIVSRFSSKIDIASNLRMRRS